MLGVRFGHLMIVPYNGDSVRAEHVSGEDWIVRVPRLWGEAWVDRAYEVHLAVEQAMLPTTPGPEQAA